MKYITVPEAYTDKNGDKKTSWNRVGILIDAKEGRQYIKLYQFPGLLFHVYDESKKAEKKSEDMDF